MPVVYLKRAALFATRHRIEVAASLILLLAALIAIPEVWGTLDGLVLSPLPYREPQRVVLAYASALFVDGPPGVLPVKYLAWRGKCPSFEALSAFRFRDVPAPDRNGRPVRIKVLTVSHDLLKTLGVRPALGRDFVEADDRPGAGPVALLTDDLWRRRFGADPAVVGRSIDLGGRLHGIVGVLPQRFWFISRQTGIWVPLAEDLNPARGLPPLINIGPHWLQRNPVIPDSLLNQNPVQVVGRLKPKATIEAARYELRSVARQTYPASGRDWVRIGPAGEVLARAIYPVFGVIGLTAGLATLIALIGAVRLDLRYWLFFAGKSYLGLVAIGCAWLLVVDPSAGLDLSRSLGEYAELITTWVFALMACGFLHLSWRDQRLRCHVCLRRMRIPAASGSWASSLLNRPRTEYLCPAGHGTVSVSAGEPGEGESSDWKDMDDSWRELFR